MIMERKIGEIFEYNGEWYQCVTGRYCDDCAFRNDDCEERERITLKEQLTKEETTGFCVSRLRSDCKSVFFKKLEKVGEPYEYDGHIFQEYHVFEEPIFTENYATIREFGVNSKISIEIKQTKEDMEEKKLNLKPFDIQKAREGKPVCTRDGRKARIICFDRNDLYPIVALIECEDGKERIGTYSKEGETEIYEIKGTGLMMLPEKKEGWVNVYKGGLLDTKSYPTKKEAFDKAGPEGYIDTIKISWEE